MSKRRFFVTGTSTGVGKTVVSSILCKNLGAQYWKPIQSGLDGPTDSEFVATIIGKQNIQPEAYRFKLPASPHLAAQKENIQISLSQIHQLYLKIKGPLVVEGAGGILVPLSSELLMIGLVALLELPVIIVAQTVLGTINHSLLTIESIRARRLPLAGIVFVGDSQPEVEQTILKLGKINFLFRVPFFKEFTTENLSQFTEFNAKDLELG